MSSSETDLELLDAYLDGELSVEQEDEVRRRLEDEPALTATLRSIRAEADLRGMAWKSYEPDDAAARRLVLRVQAALDRNTVWAYRLSRIRIGAAAAACILIGILIGRGTLGDGGASGPGARPAINTSPVGFPVQGRVGQPPAPGVEQRPGQIYVRITDANGNVTLQPFNSHREAIEFIEDIQRWQRQQEQIQSGAATPPSTGQF